MNDFMHEATYAGLGDNFVNQKQPQIGRIHNWVIRITAGGSGALFKVILVLVAIQSVRHAQCVHSVSY